ncbi:BTAD domain-containing putative transcriptional regulator [Amycolatopsis sp. A133]|uniref:AfsR/SARP family transcriptional regulator n=1 Tax=Amycolatopsis sp. A133 TaxID=3064472 RepID=UPI0027F901DA|nr:BTAD domain-containing putative transcriptional regulator [Amycolatopsis sp. A133]MDQ7803484.1 BTAD domain-containing putative transcriptional regulator [Amycolatopsis sp. A133]
MEYRILGALEVRADRAGAIALGKPKQRLLLAMLLVKANRPVGVPELIDTMWGERPPRSVLGNLQTYISSLRGLLGADRQGTPRIERQSAGYLLRVHNHELDLTNFARLVDQGRAASRTGNDPVAVELLRQALVLWRGEPLEDLDWPGGPMAEVLRITELRLSAVEDHAEIGLRLGQAPALIPELCAAVGRHPLRERFTGLLMRALAGSGRTAEALTAFAELRERLAGELGVGPGPEVRRIREEIRHGLPAPAPRHGPPARPVPRQLPVPPSMPAARTRFAKELCAQLGSPAAVAVSGLPGTGKSVLVQQLAAGLAERCPDGQLYMNFGYAAESAAVERQVLRRALRAFGVDLPVGSADEAAAVLRSTLADRRVLVVLDDVATAAHARPFLTGSPGSTVLISGRRVLATLDRVRHVRLPALSPPDAEELLGVLVGGQPEPGALRELAELCGHLPLALQVAAARLQARHWSLPELADRLRPESRRLDELRVDDISVRDRFRQCHGALRHLGPVAGPAAHTLLQGLGAGETGEVAPGDVAGDQRLSVRDAEDSLDELVDAGLVDRARRGHYHLNPLIRLFARELARPGLVPVQRVPALHGCV